VADVTRCHVGPDIPHVRGRPCLPVYMCLSSIAVVHAILGKLCIAKQRSAVGAAALRGRKLCDLLIAGGAGSEVAYTCSA
jgi:hypothetical protein